MQATQNLALKKYETTDQWHLADQSENLDKIDTAIADLTKIITATGTATAIVLPVPSVTAYVTNRKYTFVASANNGGAATTIKVNGLTAKPLYKPATTTAPTLISGKAYEVWDSGANFFFKASAEGDATAADVLAGKTFSNDNDTSITGTLALTGTAAVTEVVAGKTFYTTDPKIKLTGTGANAKRTKTGSGSFASGFFTVTGLGFTPSMIIILASSGTNRFRLVYHAASAFSGTWYFSNTGWVPRSVNMAGIWADPSGGSNGYGTFGPTASTDPDWVITADGFTTCKLPNALTASATYWAYE